MWEILGFEKQFNSEGTECTGITLHCARTIKNPDYTKASGKAVRTVWYRPKAISYTPNVGDRVVVTEEKRGNYLIVTDIEVF